MVPASGEARLLHCFGETDSCLLRSLLLLGSILRTSLDPALPHLPQHLSHPHLGIKVPTLQTCLTLACTVCWRRSPSLRWWQQHISTGLAGSDKPTGAAWHRLCMRESTGAPCTSCACTVVSHQTRVHAAPHVCHACSCLESFACSPHLNITCILVSPKPMCLGLWLTYCIDCQTL